MDLIQLKNKVQEKDNARNKLLGQKSMLVDNLKNLGFDTLADAKTEIVKLEKELAKMNKHYNSGVEEFKKKYAHLLK